MPVLDHLLWGTDDLDQGIAEIERLTGIRAVKSGRHPGYGTWNALASLGAGVYLEIIAPDPEQPGADSGRLRQIRSLKAPGLMTFAMRSGDLEALGARARAAGFQPGPVIDRSRSTPEGGTVRWRSLFVEGHPFGRWLPFGIDWMDTPHPSAHTPAGATLLAFSLSHPDAAALTAANRALGYELPAVQQGAAGFRARLATPRGEVELTG
jgi:hypothetical protein